MVACSQMVQCERGEPVTDKAGKSVPKKSQNDPTQLLADGERIASSADAVRARRLKEVADLIFHFSGSSQEDMLAKVARAVELYEDLSPADGLEGMLAAQMVGTHHAALECLRRAAVPRAGCCGQTSVPHARRCGRLRCPQRQQQCSEAWALYGGRKGNAATHP